MTTKQIVFFTLLTLLGTTIILADSVRISQIDSGNLLLTQQVKLYLSVTDNQGTPLEKLKRDQFDVLESTDGNLYKPVEEITGFQAGINYTAGINFLLLIDNSESMYWTLEGEKTNEDSLRRMSIARKAIKSFFKSVTNRNDRIGIAAYNSYYQLLAKPNNEINRVEQQLENIQRPTGDAIYSEIYASLALAIEEFDFIKGRKAIIILSDGVNNPAYTHTKKINEQFGAKFIPYTNPLEQLQLEGISLYVINFGEKTDKKDRQLITIAQQSGGVTFDAHNQSQLSQVYFQIMDQVQKEYVVTYQATTDPADRKHVKVSYHNDEQKDSVSRTYLFSTVFGQPAKSFNSFYLISVLISALLLWLLSKFKFEHQRQKPSIEVLNAGAGKLSTQVLTLGSEETIIGSSPSADMTIAGLPSVEENHATIVFDSAANKYSLKGKGKMLVNNQLVTTKILEPGDLINIDGTTMVFDEGTDKDGEK